MILSLLCLPLFFVLTRCVFNCPANAFPDNPCLLSLLPWHLCLFTNARHPKNEIQILFSPNMFWFTAASGSIGILQSFDLKSAIDILLWPWYATRTLQDSVSTTKRHMKTFDSKNVPPVSHCHAYSRQEETLVNEKPNKAARRLVPPSTAFASTLHCCLVHVCVCGNLGRGVLWCPVRHFQLAHGQEAPPAPPYGREAPYALRPHTGAEEINGGLR